MDELEAIEARWSSGDESAIDALMTRIACEQLNVEVRIREARLAERLGRASAALRAWQLVVQTAPGRVDAWAALAILHEERGDLARANACRARAGQLRGEVDEQPASMEDAASNAPSDADLLRWIERLGGREGVWARMWHDRERGTGWSPVREPLSPEILREHLAGRHTAGFYLLDAEDRVRVIILDLDATKASLDAAAGDLHRTRALHAELAEAGKQAHAQARGLGLDPLLVDSGYKGRHLWFFLPERTSAAEARAFGRRLAALLDPRSPRVRFEVFPKQDRVGPGGLGNLVKLPLGVHLRTKRRCALLDDHGEPHPEPFALLHATQAVALDTIALPAASEAPEAMEAPTLAVASTWTEADFELSTQVGPVLRGCGVLRALVEDTLRGGALGRDATVVLQHSLGHLADGVRAVNYLTERVPGFPADQRMGAPHRGSPVGCARVRQRLPELAQRVSCACPFPPEPGRYDHPLRHLEGPLDAEPPPRTLDDLLATVALLSKRVVALDHELAGARRQAMDALARVPGGRWAASDGEWVREEVDGEPILRWERR